MTRRPMAAALLAGLVSLVAGGSALAAASPEAIDRIIVKWRANPNETADGGAETRGLAARVSRLLSYQRAIGGNMSVVSLERQYSADELQTVLASLRSDPRVALAEPDRRVRAHAYTPNDPLYTGQWYLKAAQVAATRTDSAWDITRGGASPAASTVVVAVIDSGVRFDHPDLRRAEQGGKLLAGYDFVSGETVNGQTVYATANDGDGWDNDPSDPGDFLTQTDLNNPPFRNADCGGGDNGNLPLDSSWHGTRVAGLIAADTDNATGIAGTGFNVRILPVRALGKCGGHDSDVLAAMYWSAGMILPPPLALSVPPVNTTPAHVINLSLGSTGSCTSTYAEAVRDITARGVLIVVSAGNEGAAVDSPANCTGALAVAGLRHAGTKVGYSNLGPQIALGAPAGNCVNITAGSACLFSLDTTTNLGLTIPGASGYTDQFNSNVGTSFSAPLVSGVAALMKAVNPSLTPSQLTSRLKLTTRPYPTVSDTVPAPPACVSPTQDPLQDTECICNTAVCGTGMLDASAAVTDALRPTAVAAIDGGVVVGRDVTLNGSASGASVGRSITAYAWTVVSTTAGLSTPTITNANQAIATVPAPPNGSYTLQLRVTDNTGATDTVQLVVGIGGGSSNPPPTTDDGGGGELSPLWLVALALLLLARRRRSALRNTRG